MKISPSPITPRPARMWALLLSPLALAGVVWMAASLPAQAPKPEEEESAPVKTKPRPKVEEEETAPRTKHKVVRVEDEQKGPKKTVKPAAPEATTDLVTAARQWKTKNRAVYDFLNSVAVPHDIVVSRHVQKRVLPLARYLGNPPRFVNRVSLYLFLDDEWVQDKRWEVRSDELTGIQYYEQIVLDKVNDFLKQPLDKENPESKAYLSRPEMLRLAEAALSAALRYHESARQIGQREGDEFDAMAEALHKRLLEVQLEELKGLADAGDWDGAFALAIRLADAYPKPDEQLEIATPLAQLIGKMIEAGNYDEEKLRQLQQRLRQLEDRFPGIKALEPVHDKLRQQAQQLFDRAEELVEQGKKMEALELLRKAEAIWPRLPRLHDYRLKLENALAVLRVGVRELPENLIPGAAWTDSELQALDLLFESLVKVSCDPQTGEQHYAPGLVEGQGGVIPLGRQFRLAHDAFWSNDKPVTAADVRQTVRLLKDPHWPGYRPAWAEVVEDVQVGSDPYRVSLTLQRGFVDPESLMTFKVLPAEPSPGQLLRPQTAREFAQAPVGSGPYLYADSQQAPDGRAYVSFKANPNYASRGGRAGLPHIREIDFYQTRNPVKELQDHALDLVPDLPSDKVKAAQGAAGVRVQTLPETRRMYFLAVNCRQLALQGEGGENVRRAISYAINREQVLGVLRGGLGKNVHHVLTGPFPPGSWACGSENRVEFRPNMARLNLSHAKEKGVAKTVELTLKYPDGDPALAQAMKALCEQVKDVGITLTPQAVAPHDLRQQVEGSHDYDLAYYHYDFPSEAYWLWPLFDNPREGEPRGSNYLGYVDSGLQSKCGEIMAHCDFQAVQKSTRELSDMVCDKLPIIPLWQLARHVAFTSDLKTVRFDPLLIFGDVDQWRLEKK
jgi:peptide/nickel transport system substrate-binding protein